MFDRFTGRARTVVTLARDEARDLGYDELTEAHLLVGMALEGGGIAARVLRAFGVEPPPLRASLAVRAPAADHPSVSDALAAIGLDLSEVKQAIEGTFGRDVIDFPGDEPPFSLTTRTVFEIALGAALELRHNYIGTEHLLIALTRADSDVTASILSDFGTTREAVEGRALRIVARFPVIATQPQSIRARSLRRGVSKLPPQLRQDANAILAATVDRLHSLSDSLIDDLEDREFDAWLTTNDQAQGAQVDRARERMNALGVLSFVDAASSLIDHSAFARYQASRRQVEDAERELKRVADDNDEAQLSALAAAVRLRKRVVELEGLTWQEVWDHGSPVGNLSELSGIWDRTADDAQRLVLEAI